MSKKEVSVKLELPRKDYFNTIKSMLKVLLPQLEVVETGAAEIIVKNYLEEQLGGIKIASELVAATASFKLEDLDTEIIDDRYSKVDFERRIKNKFKLQIYRLLTEYLAVAPSPWGILIGVRPTKIGHSLLDQGFSYSEIRAHLSQHYGVQFKKIELLIEIIKRERQYLLTTEEAKKKVNIYLGIPFCPSRCSYCSFPAYSLKEYQDSLFSFLQALQWEINQIAKHLKKLDLVVDSIYLGGGTPTVLNSKQLEGLMKLLHKKFYHSQLREFSVEAGRPDTITESKLAILKEYQVNRISINPQTMNQLTLDRIGREHSIVEVEEAFKLARKQGFDNINLDLIIGLPGEDISDFKNTLEQVKSLAPDNLTVHTLAIKRAAQLGAEVGKLHSAPLKELKLMSEQASQLARELQMSPYYMYRQKQSLGNLENIGYARPGLESIYNIQMMEERATVIGLGGGAITKLVKSENWRLERLINPKDPLVYLQEVEQRTKQKLEELTSLFR